MDYVDFDFATDNIVKVRIIISTSQGFIFEKKIMLLVWSVFNSYLFFGIAINYTKIQHLQKGLI